MSFVLRLLLLGLLLTDSLSAAPQRQWAQLKVGISARQTITLLGQPLFRRHGKGFETWTYDQGSEVLLYGGNAVVGWTAPASANLPERSRDIWSLQPTDEYYATLHSLLQILDPVATEAATPRALPASGLDGAGTGYEQYLRAGKG